MSDWKCYQLKNLGVIKTGKTPPSSCKDAFSNTGVPFVTPKDMNGVKTIFKTERYLSKIGLDSVKNYLVPKNSIAVSCIGSDMGKAYLLSEDSVTNQQINTLIVNNNHNFEFIYYKLSIMQDYLKSIAGGSATPILNKSHFSEIEIELPDLDTQNNFVEKLKYLDKKIQLNTQINKTLEQIAQALFKSWFVDFDPVRTKVQALSDGLSLEQAELAAMQAISGKTAEELTALSQTQPDRYAKLVETAKAFPCEMVEVDGVEVPKGWEVKRIDEIANIIKGKSYKSSELEKSKTALVTLKSFNRGGGYRLDGLKEYTGKYKPEQEVFAGELIIAYTDVTQAADVIGKPAMVMSDSNYKHLVISLDVGVVRPFNDVYKHFLYCLAMTDSFQAHTKSFCTGTTVLHLGKDAVPSFEFINPNNELLHVFYKQTSPIFEKINLHIEENKNLEKARDLLLPRLLSGEIK